MVSLRFYFQGLGLPTVKHTSLPLVLQLREQQRWRRVFEILHLWTDHHYLRILSCARRVGTTSSGRCWRLQSEETQTRLSESVQPWPSPRVVWPHVKRLTDEFSLSRAKGACVKRLTG